MYDGFPQLPAVASRVAAEDLTENCGETTALVHEHAGHGWPLSRITTVSRSQRVVAASSQARPRQRFASSHTELTVIAQAGHGESHLTVEIAHKPRPVARAGPGHARKEEVNLRVHVEALTLAIPMALFTSRL